MPTPAIRRLRKHPYVVQSIIFLTAAVSFAANLYGILAGITANLPLPHLFYIPIILAAFFFPRRGVPFAAVLSALYLLMIALAYPGDETEILSAAGRCIVYLIVALVVSFLAARVYEQKDQLLVEKEEWQATFNSVPDLIALIGTDHTILRVNKAMADSLDVSQEQAVGRKCYEIVHHATSHPSFCPHAELMKDGQPHSTEVHEDRLGSDFLITTTPLHGPDGGLIGSVHVARDITQRKRDERALKSALKKLNILSSITRHDILNQIMALRTYLDLSHDDLKGTEFEPFVEKEIQVAEAIQRQIEFTKFYQDIGVNAPVWQDAGAAMRNAATQLNAGSIEIQAAVSGIEIFADPLIEKVFFNLMENSLRHGERVTKISFESSMSETGLVLTYRDNGIGIPPEERERLFQKGFGKHTGLGLFLSREILAITGITIRERGVPGEGARFEITVPHGGYRNIA